QTIKFGRDRVGTVTSLMENAGSEDGAGSPVFVCIEYCAAAAASLSPVTSEPLPLGPLLLTVLPTASAAVLARSGRGFMADSAIAREAAKALSWALPDWAVTARMVSWSWLSPVMSGVAEAAGICLSIESRSVPPAAAPVAPGETLLTTLMGLVSCDRLS